MMMKKITMIVAFLATLTISVQATSESVTSLRGPHDIDQESSTPVAKRYAKDNKPITRDYVQQPPLIPHKVDNYVINLKSNKCMSCHSWSNYQESGATKISQTHFESRDKNVLANVSARRYFCTQCHVPQVDAKPLVDNNFEPITSISGH